MRSSIDPLILKSKKVKNGKIKIITIGRDCKSIAYYDKNGICRKSKAYVYPIYGTEKDKREMDKRMRKEYKLWILMLWYYGYLDVDDTQKIEYLKLDKKNK